VLQLFDAADLAASHKEIPCTCTLQFLIRNGRLHLVTYMRSNDAYIGLPHDVFAFTMLQEILARTLGVQLGPYKHLVGSLHLYDRNRDAAAQYLREGIQGHVLMPRMPNGDPWPSIATLLRIERRLRMGKDVDRDVLLLPAYWADLVRLLQIHQRFKHHKGHGVSAIRDQMCTRVYDAFIVDRARRGKAVK
jgi:thymidylate synthase